ncbi:MAG TPA: endolytic transglycosylase MltG [Patescibacteria group bacterium]|jgi:UPF0755 protein|nr:endolytic transglycosylase MltG [Patescibacteria group bacterium]
MNEEYRIDDPKKGWHKAALLALALIFVVGVSFSAYFFTKVNKAASSESSPKSVMVEKGMTTKQIANRLKDEKIINNPFIFSLYAYLHGASAKIQAGEYTLDANMSIAEIMDVLTQGKVKASDRKAIIIEGWTNKQVADYLAGRSSNQFSADSFLQILNSANFDFKFNADAKPSGYEGFLFPDTYELARGFTPEQIINSMLKNFENKITTLMLNDMKTKNLKLSDVVIMASIVEREVGRSGNKSLTKENLEALQKERELVASVFYNRLSVGMPLQSDATVNYITGRSDRQARIEDLKIKSPYNTYLFAGLPRGPIGNPGLGSIKAAIYPAVSDYLYFLNKEDGEAVFARTIDEHNANKAKYLK